MGGGLGLYLYRVQILGENMCLGEVQKLRGGGLGVYLPEKFGFLAFVQDFNSRYMHCTHAANSIHVVHNEVVTDPQSSSQLTVPVYPTPWGQFSM